MAWQENEEPLVIIFLTVYIFFYIANEILYENRVCPQDFENDIKLLRKILTRALKQKKKFLTCEKCETTKRSVNGFISHMQFCGKTEEVRDIYLYNMYFIVYIFYISLYIFFCFVIGKASINDDMPYL